MIQSLTANKKLKSISHVCLGKNTMYKSILISLLSIMIVLHAPAQTSGIKMEGRIVNEKAEAIEFATALLRQPQDSTLIMGTTTNASGLYILSSVKPGTYRV